MSTVKNSWQMFAPGTKKGIMRTKRKTRIIFYHDNGPDLAPNDIYLISHMKKKLHGHRPKKYLNRSGKSASKVGSNACKSGLIFI